MSVIDARSRGRQREFRLYLEAQSLAALAMGKKATWDDPLAWWTLTECIVSLAKKYAGKKS